MTRGQMLRMIWIDGVLEMGGRPPLRRALICHGFGLSVPQVSIDLKRFQALFPGRMAYDKSAKVYRAGGRPAVFTALDHAAVFSAMRAAGEAVERIAP